MALPTTVAETCPHCGQPLGLTGAQVAGLLGVAAVTVRKTADRLGTYTEVREGPRRVRRRYTPEHVERLAEEFRRPKRGPKLRPP